MDDTLVSLSYQNLSKLIVIYRNHMKWAPHICSTLHMGQKWLDTIPERISIYTPRNGNWENDGTFVIIFHLYSRNCLLFFTLNDDLTNLETALINTKLIIYKKGLEFFCIHSKHYEIITKLAKNHNFKLYKPSIFCGIFMLPQEEALDFSSQLPPDYLLKNLDKSYANEVNDGWPHKYVGSEKDLELYMDLENGYGIFHEKTNKLVACVLITFIGQIGLLYTKVEYRKKGFAQILIKAIAQKIAKNGFNPMGTILDDNVSSKALFTKIGFRMVGNSIYDKID